MKKPQKAVDHPIPFVCVHLDPAILNNRPLSVVSLALNPTMTLLALGTVLVVGHCLTEEEFEKEIEKADKEFKFTKEQGNLLKEKDALFMMAVPTKLYNQLIDDDRRMTDVLVLN